MVFGWVRAAAGAPLNDGLVATEELIEILRRLDAVLPGVFVGIGALSQDRAAPTGTVLAGKKGRGHETGLSLPRPRHQHNLPNE